MWSLELAASHEEVDRATVGVGGGVQFGVHATLGSADPAARLVVRPPFF